MAKDYHIDSKYKATFSLNEKGKYTETMNNYRLSISNNRDAYPNDEAFTNYRSLKMGNLKENAIYRSVNPNDEAFNRKSVVMPLVERDQIATVMNMSETKETFLSKYSVLTPYYQKIYDANNIVFGSAEFNVFSEAYRDNLCNMLKEILNRPLPLLIHCLLGRDRTGFACAILGMLGNATYEEIVDDFMKTFVNLHFFDKENKPLQYLLYQTQIDAFLMILTGQNNIENVKTADFKNAAKEYLLAGHMSENEISDLRVKICK